ncbi:MAG TPA: hypothetical protein VEC06_09065 [Paucimonas sp.]|nr:hypothetical protein [Paucimonas sp.]
MVRRRRDILFASDAEHGHEFVAAEPSDHVFIAHAALEAVGHLDQHLVADLVPIGIVDRLEPIQIEEQHGQAAPVALGGGDELRPEFIDQRPVRQAGQAVVLRHVAHLVFGFLALGDVDMRADQFLDPAVAVERGLRTGPEPTIGAILVPQAEFHRVVGPRRLEEAPMMFRDPGCVVGMQAGLVFLEGVVDLVVPVAELALPFGREIDLAGLGFPFPETDPPDTRGQFQPELRFAQRLLDLLGDGDVFHQLDQVTDRLAVVAYRRRCHARPQDGTILAQEALFLDEGSAAPGYEIGLQCLVIPQIVGMHQALGGEVPHFLGAVAEHLAKCAIAADNPKIRQGNMDDADRRLFEGGFQFPLAFAQRRFDFALRCHVGIGAEPP